MGGLFWISADVDISMKWDVDFQGAFNSASAHLEGSPVAEWGTMEWGLFEWGGGTTLKSAQVPINGAGQYVRIGVTASISGASFAVQKMTLFTKIGRTAK
jgi:hypothetical protein